MKDDLLEEAARALRRETEADDDSGKFTRARVMATLHQSTVKRRTRMAFILPLAASFAAATAWGTVSGKAPGIARTVVEALGFDVAPRLRLRAHAARSARRHSGRRPRRHSWRPWRRSRLRRSKLRCRPRPSRAHRRSGPSRRPAKSLRAARAPSTAIRRTIFTAPPTALTSSIRIVRAPSTPGRRTCAPPPAAASPPKPGTTAPSVSCASANATPPAQRSVPSRTASTAPTAKRMPKR